MLVDADTLVDVPPADVRKGARPGDLVKLGVIVPAVDGWGEGVQTVPAHVTEALGEGRFLGVLPDGDPVEFSESHILSLAVPEYGMGGIWDWLKKLAPPSPIPETTGLPIVRQPSLPIPVPEKKPSFLTRFLPPPLELFKPKEHEEKAPWQPMSLFEPEQEEKAQPMSLFEPEVAPAPPREMVPAPVTELFQPAPVERPARELFQPFSEAEVEPRENVEIAPDAAGFEYTKVLPFPPRRTLLPTPEEVARAILTWSEPAEEHIWRAIREERKSEWFQEELAASRETGEAARIYLESFGSDGGHPTAWEELAAAFHIPWSEFLRIGEAKAYVYEGKEYMELEAPDAVFEEIIFPLAHTVSQAFDLIKPPDIPGFLTIDDVEGSGDMMALTYYEDLQDPYATPREDVGLEEMVPPEALGPLMEVYDARLAGELTVRQALQEIADILDPHVDGIRALGHDPENIAQLMANPPGAPVVEEEAPPEKPKKKKRKKK